MRAFFRFLLLAALVPWTALAAGATDLGEDNVERAKGDGLEIIATVNFFSGQSELSPRGRSILAALAPRLAADPGMKLELAGHTDNSGEEAFNVQLSEQRARAVGKFLVEHGVAPGRLSVIGYGMWSPLERNETEAGRAKNRRAEVKISP
jgi:outer membrane protein OmpA-like peptidoglycan-associated protein